MEVTMQTIVRNKKMYLMLQVGESIAYLPYDMAPDFKRVVERLVPYRYGDVLGPKFTFDALAGEEFDE